MWIISMTILHHPDFVSGNTDIEFIETWKISKKEASV